MCTEQSDFKKAVPIEYCPEVKSFAGGPLISLCMIARDNEKTIDAALTSAKRWVDEIIVVDTGSIDRTPEIAREHGARVEYFPWCDDFAAARNKSLQYASGKWVFWIDTDDTLPDLCGKQVHDMVRGDVPDDVLGFIMQVHCPQDPARPDIGNGKPNVDLLNTNGNALRCVTVVDHVKLFRNREDLRFEGRIHEQILPSIRRADGRVLWSDSHVVHSGADYSPEGKRRKLDRDLRLLRKDIQERPNHPFVLFNLGMTLQHQGEFREAVSCLEKCIVLSTTDESHLRKAYVLLSDSLEGLGQINEARRRCWEGLGRYPNDPELAFKLGRILMMDRKWQEAIAAFQRGMSPNRERYFSSIDPEIGGFKTYANLAVCNQELGQHADAIDDWIDCLEHMPDFEDAWDGILQASRALGDPVHLARVASQFKNRPEANGLVSVCEAIVMGSNGFIDEAVLKFENALQSGHDDWFVLNEYARFLNEHQRWDDSLAILRRLRSIDPTNPSPHFNLGICQSQLKRFPEASRALQTALQLRPGHRRTQELLVQCRQEMRSSAIAVNPGDCSSRDVVLAVCFTRGSDPQRNAPWNESGDLAFAIDHWIQGLANNQLTGVIIYDGISGEFVAQRTSEFVSFQYREQGTAYSPLDLRFLAIREYLENHPEIERVFCTDLFDVGIVGNPFHLVEEYGPLCVGSEPTAIGENFWIQDRWQQVWGSSPPPELESKRVLNCGIFGGQRSAVLDLCSRMQKHIERLTKDGRGVDMPVYNQVLYCEIGDGNFWSGQEPLHSVFKEYQYERTDVAFVHK